jgi:hypothetical protein
MIGIRFAHRAISVLCVSTPYSFFAALIIHTLPVIVFRVMAVEFHLILLAAFFAIAFVQLFRRLSALWAVQFTHNNYLQLFYFRGQLTFTVIPIPQ